MADEEPKPTPPAGGGADDATTRLPRPVSGAPVSGGPAGGAPSDPTEIRPRPSDATQVDGPVVPSSGPSNAPTSGPPTTAMPPVEAAPRWSATAPVRPPGSAPVRPSVWEEDVPVDDPYGGRSWFTPVLAGLVALVLLAALAFGGWLIYNATSGDDEDPAPGASVSDVPATATVPATSAPPASSAPAATTSAPPAQVPVPDVVGNSEATATARLTALGLNVQVERRTTNAAAAGTVLETDPAATTMVAPGSTVKLVVARAPATSSPPAPPASPSPSGD